MRPWWPILALATRSAYPTTPSKQRRRGPPAPAGGNQSAAAVPVLVRPIRDFYLRQTYLKGVPFTRGEGVPITRAVARKSHGCRLHVKAYRFHAGGLRAKRARYRLHVSNFGAAATGERFTAGWAYPVKREIITAMPSARNLHVVTGLRRKQNVVPSSRKREIITAHS